MKHPVQSWATVTARPPHTRCATVVSMDNRIDKDDLEFVLTCVGILQSHHGYALKMEENVLVDTQRKTSMCPLHTAADISEVSTVDEQRKLGSEPILWYTNTCKVQRNGVNYPPGLHNSKNSLLRKPRATAILKKA